MIIGLNAFGSAVDVTLVLWSLLAVVAAWLALRAQRGRAALEPVGGRLDPERTESGELLHAVMETVPASVVLVGQDYRIVAANATARRVHASPLIDRYCYEMLAGRTDKCPSCVPGRTNGPRIPARLVGEHRSRTTGELLQVKSVPVELSARPYELVVEEPVTERRQLEAYIAHREKLAIVGQMVTGVAHDIGNPLSSIRTQLQGLRDDDLSPSTAATLTTVQREVDRLARLLRELTASVGHREDRPELVSVPSIVEDALKLIRHDRRMRRKTVSVDMDPDPPRVHMVGDRLMQVVLNLIVNALDAMPDGGALRIAVQAAGEGIDLTVQDSGAGMDPSVLASCFEPFFSTKSGSGNAGLGLSMAREIVEAAGGTIALESLPGRGTTVHVRLPAASGSTRSAHRLETPQPGVGGSA